MKSNEEIQCDSDTYNDLVLNASHCVWQRGTALPLSLGWSKYSAFSLSFSHAKHQNVSSEQWWFVMVWRVQCSMVGSTIFQVSFLQQMESDLSTKGAKKGTLKEAERDVQIYIERNRERERERADKKDINSLLNIKGTCQGVWAVYVCLLGENFSKVGERNCSHT